MTHLRKIDTGEAPRPAAITALDDALWIGHNDLVQVIPQDGPAVSEDHTEATTHTHVGAR